MTFVRIPSVFEVRPISSTGVVGTTGLSATLLGPPDSHGLRVGSHTPPSMGLAVLRLVCLCMHAVTTTPAGPLGAPVARFPSDGSLPRILGASAPALPFSRPARRSLLIMACMLAELPHDPFLGGLQRMSLPPSAAPRATGWSDLCRSGVAPAEDQRLVTAHQNLWVVLPATSLQPPCRTILTPRSRTGQVKPGETSFNHAFVALRGASGKGSN